MKRKVFHKSYTQSIIYFTAFKCGCWNEYLREEIKRVVVKKYQDDEVLKLCEPLAETQFKNIKEMLKENEFYKDKIK